MSGKDLQEPTTMSLERLFSNLLPIIPKVVSQACANLGYHPNQMELYARHTKIWI